MHARTHAHAQRHETTAAVRCCGTHHVPARKYEGCPIFFLFRPRTAGSGQLCSHGLRSHGLCSDGVYKHEGCPFNHGQLAADNSRVDMAYVVMAYVVMAYVVMAYVLMAYIRMAYISMMDVPFEHGQLAADSCVGMAYGVMAFAFILCVDGVYKYVRFKSRTAGSRKLGQSFKFQQILVVDR